MSRAEKIVMYFDAMSGDELDGLAAYMRGQGRESDAYAIERGYEPGKLPSRRQRTAIAKRMLRTTRYPIG